MTSRALQHILVSLLVLPLILCRPITAQDVLPRFEKAACLFQTAEDMGNITCGRLIVPENHSRPNGRLLRLAVAIVHSTSTAPEPDPLVFLEGGPGAGSLMGLPFLLRSPLWRPIRAKRDLIFYDQRGTGFSEPAFCPELNIALATMAMRGLSVQEQAVLDQQALGACRERMLREGLDFSTYNSAAGARDLDDLRRVLGYRQWNLFGISYGTRLALTAMRDTPEGIRSVILDSPLPPNARQDVDGPSRYARSLGLVFEQCAADEACHRAFPTLEEDYYATLDSLERRPVVLAMPDTVRFPHGRIVIDGTLFAQGIFQGLYYKSFIPVLPLVIEAAKARNTSVLTALADGLVHNPHGINAGLAESVVCYEGLPFNPPEMIEAERARYPRLRPWYDVVNQRTLCEAWHDKRADSLEFQPVRSDIPALILSGEFDPITPPTYGHLAASTLPHSTFVEARSTGHFVLLSTECAQTLAVAFLDDPVRPLDTSCVDAQPPVQFVTAVHYNSGVYRLTSTLQRGPNLMLMTGLGLMSLLLFLGIVLWPLGIVVRRLGSGTVMAKGGQRTASGLAGITSLLALGFIGGLVAVVFETATTNPYLLAFGIPMEVRALFVLPWIVMALTIGVVILCVLSWKHRWWRLPGRLCYTLIAAACVGFVVWVSSWRLL